MSRKMETKKARYWEKMVEEAERSGMTLRQFCRERELHESQFHWWRRKLKQKADSKGAEPASFLLVSSEAASEAGLELVLDGGRRLLIHRGVDAATLRTVVAALESGAC